MIITIYESYSGWIAKVGELYETGDIIARGWDRRSCYYRAKVELMERGVSLETVKFEYK
jgi:hypothetical protein